VTLIYEARERERETDTKYFHNPIVEGVNYSLFGMVLMESKGQSGAASAASPLLSSYSADLFHVFYLSPQSRHEIAQGVLYIVSFRSKRVCGDQQDCVERTHEGEMGPTTQSRSGPAWCVLFSSLLRSLLTFSSHDP
jgi:hypothetical protein